MSSGYGSTWDAKQERIREEGEKQPLDRNGFPRANRGDLWSYPEMLIQQAINHIEKLPASEYLTDAVVLLTQARVKVARYIDTELNKMR